LMGFGDNMIWGTTSNDTYSVGDGGKIEHNQNGNWTEIESHTTQIINDIWGTADGQTILCAVSSKYSGGEQKMLKITGNNADTITWATGRGAYSVWTQSGFPVYVCGDGVFTNKSNSWKELKGFPNAYSNRVRGTGLNNIFIVGDYGLLLHYNGSTWKSYNDYLWTGMIYHGLAVRGNKFAIAGEQDGKAILITGTIK